jgi:hypothetical protein
MLLGVAIVYRGRRCCTTRFQVFESHLSVL